jgi:hypothetical protein
MTTYITRTSLDFTFYSPVAPRDWISFVEIRKWAWGKQYSAKRQTLLGDLLKN